MPPRDVSKDTREELMIRRTKLGALLALAVLAVSAVAEAKLARTNDTADVVFLATGPGGMKIKGTTHTLNVVDDGQLVKVFVPLNTLDTEIDLRNKHMKEKYLETVKYPNAELQVPRASLKFPAPGASSSGEAQGTMSIHGVSKPVTFKYDVASKGTTLDVNGKVRLDMKDFGITQPSYLGVSVKTEVDISVHFRATDG
jgi:polyisoprenoid-binding protein YceI